MSFLLTRLSAWFQCDLGDFWNQLDFLIESFVDYSFEIKASRAKIDEQSDLQIVSLQIINGLREMDVFQFKNSLQFHSDDGLYQEIRSSGADALVLVVDRYLVLTAEANPLVTHFD